MDRHGRGREGEGKGKWMVREMDWGRECEGGGEVGRGLWKGIGLREGR